ncbi:MAG: efflux RND transporter periplasmic adaptor subunit, partial [Alphaproteobacteria bacterium]|nr:efflux RND transporter periplasmic adaptor subunit [Alphaproteobacteria bacterium]
MTAGPTEDPIAKNAEGSSASSTTGLRRSWRAQVGGRRGLLVFLGLVVIVAATLAYFYTAESAPKPQYRLSRIERGPIVSAVTASGTAQALVTVQVGSQLSGRIKELLVDFNDRVKKGQIIARLDIDHLTARLQQAEADHKAAVATLAMQTAQQEKARHDVALAEAQLQKVKAALVEAKREVVRKLRLATRGIGPRADAEKAETALRQAEADIAASEAQLAGAGASLKVAAAQVASADATVAQRQASVRLVKVDLERSEIRSPIDGVVVERSVDVGQTVAASLSSPVLFRIAQDLRNMQVEANIDEADIGNLREGNEVSFTVDAYPEREFTGSVRQIRKAPNVSENVVTYTAVIATRNDDLRLLPGMTADIEIITGKRRDVLRVDNSALRFKPRGGEAGAGAGAGAGQSGAQLARGMTQRLTRTLDLSPEQQSALEEALAKRMPSRGGGAEGDGGDPSQRFAQIRAALENILSGILT